MDQGSLLPRSRSQHCGSSFDQCRWLHGSYVTHKRSVGSIVLELNVLFPTHWVLYWKQDWAGFQDYSSLRVVYHFLNYASHWLLHIDTSWNNPQKIFPYLWLAQLKGHFVSLFWSTHPTVKKSLYSYIHHEIFVNSFQYCRIYSIDNTIQGGRNFWTIF